MHVEERISFRVILKRLKERLAVNPKDPVEISAGYLCKIFNETISKVNDILSEVEVKQYGD